MRWGLAVLAAAFLGALGTAALFVVDAFAAPSVSTNTILTVAGSGASYGAETVVGFSGNVSSSDGTPTGQVTVDVKTTGTSTVEASLTCTLHPSSTSISNYECSVLSSTALAPGAYHVHASYPGTSTFEASATTQSLTITKATPAAPSITNVPTSPALGGSFTATVSTTSAGSAKSVTSSTTSVCTVASTVDVSFVGAGTCTLTAHEAATTDDDAKTGSTQTFSVDKVTPSAAPSITDVPTSPAYGGSFTATVSTTSAGSAKSVTSSTTSVCTVASTVDVSFVGAGTCTLTAHEAATTDDNAKTGSAQTFAVDKATPSAPSITNVPTSPAYGGGFAATVSTTGTGTTTVTSSTTSVCTVTTTGLEVDFVGVGACTLTAHVAAGTDYDARTGTRETFTVTYESPRSSSTLYVVDRTGDALDAFPLSANGDVVPSTTATALDGPVGTAFDASGDLWVANAAGNSVVEYTAASLSAGTPTVETVITSHSTSLDGPQDLAFTATGNLWVSNATNTTVVELARATLPTGGALAPEVVLSGSSIDDPEGLAFDSTGNLWVANRTGPGSGSVVEIAKINLSSANPPAKVTITSSSLGVPDGLAFDAAGDLWVGSSSSAAVVELTPGELSTGGTTLAPAVSLEASTGAEFPAYLAFDAAGDLWATYPTSSTVREYTPSELQSGGSVAAVSTIDGATTGLDHPLGIAIYTVPATPRVTTPTPTPPSGTTTHQSCAVSSGTCSITNDGVTLTASPGPGALTVSEYPSNPVTGPSFTSTDEYFDVEVASGSSFSSVTLEDCNLSGGTVLHWWQPAPKTWGTVSPVSGPTGTPPCLTATLSSTSTPTISELTGVVFAVGTPSAAPLIRVSGKTADATAADEFERAFPSTKGSCPASRDAVIATTTVYQDALSGQFLAQSLTTGTLLTPTSTLSTVTAATLQQEGIKTVYVVGGPLAVTTTVLKAIETLTAYGCGGTTPMGKIAVTRLFGSTQYGTAAAVAEHVGTAANLAFAAAYSTTNGTDGTGKYNVTGGKGSSAPTDRVPTAILASGEEFQDAQSASVISYRTKLPLLLTPATALSTTTVEAIQELGVRQVILVGGTLAVSNNVEAALIAETGVSVLRVAGQDYTDTARELARFEVAGSTAGLGWTPGQRVMVARGNGFTDGLAGAVLDSRHNTATGTSGTARPLVLTESPTTIGTYLTTFLKVTGHTGVDATRTKTITGLTVLGGTLAVSTAEVAAMQTDLSH